jgi:integrase
MSIRQIEQRNGSGRLFKFLMIDVTYRHPDGRRERVRKAAEIQNQREAKHEEAQILAALASGTYTKQAEKQHVPTSDVPLFRDFAKTFIDTYATTNNKPSEVESKRSILKNHLLPAFGATPLDEIRTEQIERYKAAKLKAKLDPKTVNNHLTVLRRMLSLAQEWEMIAAVPKVKWLKAGEIEFRFLTFDEADALIANAGDWTTMITIGARTGLRIGELLALRWCDVDLAGGRIFVRRAVSRGKIGTPKSGKAREVALSDEAIRALKSHRHLRGELVFCDDAGKMLTRGAVKWPLWSASDRAAVKRMGWHVLRHTFASHLAIRGVSLKAIQELMGHSTMAVTMRYAHLSPDVTDAHTAW